MKDGKLYEDVAPYGVFDKNDRHIYTNRGFYEKDSYSDLSPERLESRGEIYVDADENGNAAGQFVVDHTSLKSIRIGMVLSAFLIRMPLKSMTGIVIPCHSRKMQW